MWDDNSTVDFYKEKRKTKKQKILVCLGICKMQCENHDVSWYVKKEM